MKWQWKIGTFAGIDVFVHATFLLLIGWVALSHWINNQSWAAVLDGIVFILLLFVFVVLHEYGHALTARHYGIKTRDITLYPIGGLARLERMPEKPIEELWVALAGPAVNLVLAAVLFAYLVVTGALTNIAAITVTQGSLIERLMVVNLLLLVFNLIPAFPMDGGRVLRALLALRLDYVKATQTAASIGQGLAFVFGFIGLFTDPMLLFIAFFVWIGAAQEASMVQVKSALGGIPVNQAMQTQFQSLSSRDPLSQMVQLILAGAQHDFPVVDDGRVVGMVTRRDFITGLTQHGQGIGIAAVMRTGLPQIDSYDMVETALTRLQESGLSSLPVTHAGQLVGLITHENITEFMMIRSALKATHRAA